MARVVRILARHASIKQVTLCLRVLLGRCFHAQKQPEHGETHQLISDNEQNRTDTAFEMGNTTTGMLLSSGVHISI